MNSSPSTTATVVLGNLGSISVSGNALVLSNLAFATTDFLQTGGSISADNPSGFGFYLARAGVTHYTMTGGTISTTSNTNAALGGGPASQGYLTINGPGALASFPTLNLNSGTGDIGNLTLENGTLAVDNLLTQGATAPSTFSGFNFSGGTLQPIDSNVSAWGSSNIGNNFVTTLAGSGATMSSNDSSGSAQTVQVYTVLTGAGALTFTGSGTIVLNNNAGSDYSGGSFVTGGGTVQLARANGLGSGPLTIIGAAVDLDGVNSTVGALTGDSSALITNNGGSGGTLTTNPSSGAATTYAGTIADGPFATTALTLTGSGTLYLTGTNTYSGGTTVTGNAELIVTGSASLIDGSSLSVGNALAFGSAVPAAADIRPASAVPEPGALVLLAAGAALMGMFRRRR